MFSDMYNDVILEVKRSGKTVNEYGRTIQGWNVVYENIPCRLSQSNFRATENGTINSSRNSYKIFLENDWNINQNDILIVEKGGIKYKFKANQPIRYTDLIEHQEIIVEEVDKNET